MTRQNLRNDPVLAGIPTPTCGNRNVSNLRNLIASDTNNPMPPTPYCCLHQSKQLLVLQHPLPLFLLVSPSYCERAILRCICICMHNCVHIFLDTAAEAKSSWTPGQVSPSDPLLQSNSNEQRNRGMSTLPIFDCVSAARGVLTPGTPPPSHNFCGLAMTLASDCKQRAVTIL